MSHYPIALNLDNKSILVVGGGTVAERKVGALLETGADITVVSPELTPKLEEQKDQDLISCERKNYQTADIEDEFLVIGATNSPDVNKQIAEDAFARNLLVNIVDQPEISNFNVPAVVREGALCLSISTGGKSPALSGRIRRELEEGFGVEYDHFLELMGDLRGKIIAKVNKERVRKQIFKDLAYSKAIKYMQEGSYQQAIEIINNILPSEIKVALLDDQDDQDDQDDDKFKIIEVKEANNEE
ncbi:precorrin-2 dehydrogenase/sirohydrochlorin ferrochelatase family protein [Selenihalanaerobacter shriftii]|uniref:precorrin-2 dehydrogenase n=1 Tax=Selenihalanaerobacter shriftii TaxID=142842 RepID=A0A1T4MIG7_9FIRM|nr:bifunctional precorrin-2 dehydrogenase/sirohydrochlorin ferrochelatase [Selenihalanaerobacter shriftii]SJZ66655.1 precorrin-2 dehydrogenase [Selenihalanaerobacter shriftii]